MPEQRSIPSEFARGAVAVTMLLALSVACAQGPSDARLQALARTRALSDRAELLHRQGRTNEALTVATEAIRAAPEVPGGWMLRGRLRAIRGEFADAAGDFAKVLELQPGDPDARFLRALARFRQGRLEKSLEDFDRLIEIAPDRTPELWQRGVALSLAGRHAEARLQFESHRRANSNDVEVALWHFLSVARLQSPAAARTNLMAVTGDSRIPMSQLHDLYAGTGTLAAVDHAVKAATGTELEKQAARFYGRLYVAMYYDASGEPAKAVAPARQAADLSAPFDFMGQTARLYADQVASRAGSRDPDRDAPP